MARKSIKEIVAAKNKSPLVMITAYDALFAKLFEPYVDMILVGDSLNMSFNGKNDTLSLTLEEMIYHTKAVCNGAKKSFVICDLPFGYTHNKKTALESSIRVFKETQAQAVKIEGASEEKIETIFNLCRNSIAVMGHIGLLPQNVRQEGGYIIKGKEKEEKEKLINEAKKLERVGVFAIVIEGVKPQVAKEVTQSVNIPVIGIGAGKDVDGQVLVWSDMLGFYEEFKPKFVKRYMEGALLTKEAVKKFASEVKEKKFPSKEYSY
jgi:3-methyl-2-oxobutanoate hydroxymethyltransferase